MAHSLQGIDNVYIERYNDDGTRMITFNSFSTDYLVADGAAVCKIDPVLIISTHGLACDYCKEVFIGVKHIQYVVLSSLNRRSANKVLLEQPVPDFISQPWYFNT